jgi:hypothetical protein
MSQKDTTAGDAPTTIDDYPDDTPEDVVLAVDAIIPDRADGVEMERDATRLYVRASTCLDMHRWDDEATDADLVYANSEGGKVTVGFQDVY